MKLPRRSSAIIAVVMLVSANTFAQDSFLQRLGIKKSPSSLSEGTISDGLRDALKIGIERTVAATGKENGYFKNDKIKIRPPKTFQRIDKPCVRPDTGRRLTSSL